MPISQEILDQIARRDPNVFEIYLNGEQIVDEDIPPLVEALNQNPHIKVLLLQQNQITDEGAIALANLQHVKELYLDLNSEISDNSVASLAANPVFTHLGLESCDISRIGAGLLLVNPRLEYLDLSHNDLEECVVVVPDNSKLRELRVCYSRVDQNLLQSLHGANVRILLIAGNDLTEGQLRYVAEMPRLGHLTLGVDQITNFDIARDLAARDFLTSFYFPNPQFEGDFLGNLQDEENADLREFYQFQQRRLEKVSNLQDRLRDRQFDHSLQTIYTVAKNLRMILSANLTDDEYRMLSQNFINFVGSYVGNTTTKDVFNMPRLPAEMVSNVLIMKDPDQAALDLMCAANYQIELEILRNLEEEKVPQNWNNFPAQKLVSALVVFLSKDFEFNRSNISQDRPSSCEERLEFICRTNLKDGVTARSSLRDRADFDEIITALKTQVSAEVRQEIEEYFAEKEIDAIGEQIDAALEVSVPPQSPSVNVAPTSQAAGLRFVGFDYER